MAIELTTNAGTRDKGYELLMNYTRPVLVKYLNSLFVHGVDTTNGDHEDIVSVALIKIWEKRNEYSFETRKEWWKLAKLVVDRERLDRRRSSYEKRVRSIENSAEYQEIVSVQFEERLDALDETKTLIQTADELWLGKKTKHFRGLCIGAELLLTHDVRRTVMEKILKRYRLVPQELNAHEIAVMISGDAVMKHTAFRFMKYSPEALFDHVKSNVACSSSEEDILLKQRVLLFNSRKEILKGMNADRTKQVSQFLNAVDSAYPFTSKVQKILRQSERHAIQSEGLKDRDLWKRVIFHYHYHPVFNKAPHSVLLEWFEVPSGLLGTKLTKNTLQGWISDRRLIKEVKKKIGVHQDGE